MPKHDLSKDEYIALEFKHITNLFRDYQKIIEDHQAMFKQLIALQKSFLKKFQKIEQELGIKFE